MNPKPASANTGETLVITRVIQAPCALVYQAWTDTAHMAEWFRPEDSECRDITMDLKIGGAIRIHLHAPKGDNIALGKFTEIIPNKRLQFTFEWQHYPMPNSILTLDFEDLGPATRFTLTHSGLPDKEDAIDHTRGWGSIASKSKRWLETKAAARIRQPGTKSQWVGKEFVLKRTFNAPRGMVFQAWTDPAQLVQWWGPRGFTNPVCEWLPRSGESLYVVMRGPGPDGGRYPMGGEFREILPPERLVFTSGALNEHGELLFEFLHTAIFEDRGEQTEFTLRSVVTRADADADRYIGGFEAGMGQSLERLTELLPGITTPLIVERVLNAPPELVWQALTEKDRISQWSFNMVDFKPEVGFEFEFTAQKGDVKYVHHCQITEAIPNKKLAYTWRYVGFEGGSLVTFELFPEDGKTRLRLTHTGIETFPKTEDYARKNFMMGWTELIGQTLRAHVEK